MPSNANKSKTTKDGKVPCAIEDCTVTFKNRSGMMGHLRWKHNLSQEEVDQVSPTKNYRDVGALVERNLRNRGVVAPATEHEPAIAGHMLVEDDIIRTYTPPPLDPGEISIFKGQVRRRLLALKKLPDDVRERILEYREWIMDALKELRSKDLTASRFGEIRDRFEDTIVPELETAINGPGAPAQASIMEVSADTQSDMKKGRLQAEIRDLLSRIATLPQEKKAGLEAERDAIITLNRKLTSPGVTPKQMKEIGSLLNTEIKPVVDAVSGAKGRGGRASSGSNDDIDEFLEDLDKEKQRQFKQMQLDNRLTHEMIKSKDLMDTLKTRKGSDSGGGGPPGYVPARRPVMMDGKVINDDSGNPVYEDTYVPPGGMDSGMASIINTLIKQDSGDKPMMDFAMNQMNNQNAMMIEQMKAQAQKEPVDVEKIMLQVQQKNTELMMEMMKSKSDSSNENQRQIEELRQQTVTMQADLYRNQMERMEEKMHDLEQMAYADPMERIVRNKAQLIELGMVNSSAQTAETKTIEEMGRMFNTALNKADTVVSSLSTLIQPLAQAQADNMRQKGQMRVPRARSELDRAQQYAEMLENIEQVEEP